MQTRENTVFSNIFNVWYKVEGMTTKNTISDKKGHKKSGAEPYFIGLYAVSPSHKALDRRVKPDPYTCALQRIIHGTDDVG